MDDIISQNAENSAGDLAEKDALPNVNIEPTDLAEPEAEKTDEPKAEKRSVKSIVVRLLAVFAFVLVFAVGLIIMLYPSISDYVNHKNQSRAVSGYREAVNAVDSTDYESYIESARDYNNRLYSANESIKVLLNRASNEIDKTDEYWNLLSLKSSNIIGYVEIEILDIEVPLYHGSSDITLAMGAGHMQGTSLPVGGENTHSVVIAHTGLPSAKYFDGVDRLKQGDTFQFYIMNEILTYQVDQIITVLPDEVDELAIMPGGDYATLVTCTPYGINSHRLLVRGYRIETPPEQVAELTAKAEAVEEKTFLAKAGDSVISFLGGIVEGAANVVVRIAEWGMDIFGVEY